MFRTVNTLTKTAIAAELSHSLSLNETAFAIGTQHGPDSLTLIKARVNTYARQVLSFSISCGKSSIYDLRGGGRQG
ncbi:hypothetical protein L1049_021522 [Liquidambar formosana]|uniref:Uncharacterized protein n=1 Tax=Liquidambar formosana TaxID=63359 RepID=A0AAP0N5J4_LIQFO